MDCNLFQNKIKLFNIISFDLFDTLLSRTFLIPTDLFYFIEEKEQQPGFYDARIEAEKKAFYKNNTSVKEKYYEVTLKQIYDVIDPRYKKLELIEMEYEKQCIYCNPKGRELYNLACVAGKKIIFVSDTYLPENFIVQILKQIGYNQFEKIFISSTLNKTKRDGNLYKHLIKEMKLSEHEVLHIGDNFHSDVKQAQKNGLSTFYFTEKNFATTFSNSRNRVLSKIKSDSLSNSNKANFSLLAKMDLHVHRYEASLSEFWEKVGYCFAGPMVIGFVRWIEDYAKQKQVDHVVFVARDGYIIQMAFKFLNSSIVSSYLYLNRSVIEHLRQDQNLLREFINSLKKQSLFGKKILMIDVGTNNFSTQRFLIDLNLTIEGGYWCTGKDNPQLKYKKYFQQEDLNISSFMNSGVIEFFMTSPEPPIITIKFENDRIVPVFSTNIHQYETYRGESVEQIKNGVLLFAKYYQLKLKELDPVFTAKDIILWNNLWLNHPTREERKYFKKIFHASDDQHQKYLRQFIFKDEVLYRLWLKIKEKIVIGLN